MLSALGPPDEEPGKASGEESDEAPGEESKRPTRLVPGEETTGGLPDVAGAADRHPAADTGGPGRAAHRGDARPDGPGRADALRRAGTGGDLAHEAGEKAERIRDGLRARFEALGHRGSDRLRSTEVEIYDVVLEGQKESPAVNHGLLAKEMVTAPGAPFESSCPSSDSLYDSTLSSAPPVLTKTGVSTVTIADMLRGVKDAGGGGIFSDYL